MERGHKNIYNLEHCNLLIKLAKRGSPPFLLIHFGGTPPPPYPHFVDKMPFFNGPFSNGNGCCVNCILKIPYKGDKESLDQCG